RQSRAARRRQQNTRAHHHRARSFHPSVLLPVLEIPCPTGYFGGSDADAQPVTGVAGSTRAARRAKR
ncbi:MAG: hypothetical protein M3409_01040, partial [Gemmatimonadota bacterium]|nr:hypothetical protein [Gemmatimonadota bacterium]